jgi:hypothetical protein
MLKYARSSFYFLTSACSFGLSATSQQYFSLRTTSHQQPAGSTFLSEHTSTGHQPPAKRTGRLFGRAPAYNSTNDLTIAPILKICRAANSLEFRPSQCKLVELSQGSSTGDLWCGATTAHVEWNYGVEHDHFHELPMTVNHNFRKAQEKC